jgi:hypothetical protein
MAIFHYFAGGRVTDIGASVVCSAAARSELTANTAASPERPLEATKQEVMS